MNASPEPTPAEPAPAEPDGTIDRRPSRVELLEVLGGMAAIFVLDLFAGWQIQFATMFPKGTSDLLDTLEIVGSVVFVLVALIVVAPGARRNLHTLLRIFTVYLVVATVQMLANITALLGYQHERTDSYLWGLWDVGAAYLMIVAVFTGWYWVADRFTPGGAFEFPARAGDPPTSPNLVDYVFIAFNTNATFGPTSESVMSRKVKVLMMFQTVCSLVVLLILVARLVALSN